MARQARAQLADDVAAHEFRRRLLDAVCGLQVLPLTCAHVLWLYGVVSARCCVMPLNQRPCGCSRDVQAMLERDDLGALHPELVRDGPALVAVLVQHVPKARVPGLVWVPEPRVPAVSGVTPSD